MVDRYRLADSRALQEEFHTRAQGGGELREWLADRLLANLEVELSRNSNVFHVAYAASEAGDAALVANALAEAYIQTTIELKLDPAKRQSRWFDEQLLGLRGKLEEAQSRLADFQRKNALVTTDGRLDVETARLAGIATEALAAQTAAADAQTRRAQMKLALEKGRTAELPDILGNNLLQSMKADLTRAESKLAEVSERYGASHPNYVSAAAEVNSLRQRLAAELGTARGSIEQTAQIAEQRAAEMEKSLEEQKQRILELRRVNDERDVLSREVESAQRAYEAATQRASAVRLESQLDQSTVAVLVPATRPLTPARPRVDAQRHCGAFLRRAVRHGDRRHDRVAGSSRPQWRGYHARDRRRAACRIAARATPAAERSATRSGTCSRFRRAARPPDKTHEELNAAWPLSFTRNRNARLGAGARQSDRRAVAARRQAKRRANRDGARHAA